MLRQLKAVCMERITSAIGGSNIKAEDSPLCCVRMSVGTPNVDCSCTQGLARYHSGHSGPSHLDKPDYPNDTHTGWVFADPKGEPFTNTIGLGGPFPATLEGLEPDPIFHARSIQEFYERAKDKDGKYSVPILWDTKLHTIVSNESSEIICMFNSEFNEFAKHPDLDLYPEGIRKDIDSVNEWIYPTINNGVYRCGFAKSQESYDIAIGKLTESFDRIDQILQKQRYIAGDRLTEADVRLFVTLLRFDEVYVVYFKTNTRSVTYCV